MNTGAYVKEHVYRTRSPTFYFCYVHSHYHISHPKIPCVIQTYKCCENAVFVKDYTNCFLVKVAIPPPQSTASKLNDGTGAAPTTTKRKRKASLNQESDAKRSKTTGTKSAETDSTGTAGHTTRKRKINKTLDSDSKRRKISSSDDDGVGTACKTITATSTCKRARSEDHDGGREKIPKTDADNDENRNCKIPSNNGSHEAPPQNTNKSFTEYIIFDPSIWREQSFNHFVSFLRAVIALPAAAAQERYLRFENSNFTISNVKKYISTKDSVIRSSITGFETYGVYQTAIISCTIPYYTVVLPQKLYDILEAEGYDMDLVLVLRHPSIKPTCMFVCKVLRNPDPYVDVIIISDQQSVGMNQDQDGDQNGVFLLRKRINGYDNTKSYMYKVAKMELAKAFRNKQTLIARPRYLLSENSLLKIKRNVNDFLHLEYFKRTYAKGIRYMNEAAAGYLSKEYDEFQAALCHHNKNEKATYLSVDDFCLDTNRIPSIVSSGAQTNPDLIPMALNNVSSKNSAKSLVDLEKDMLSLCNNYISSSIDLSRNGRKAFASLYALHDMVAFMFVIYINKVAYGNCARFASCFAFLFNEASLDLCVKELEALPEEDDENESPEGELNLD